MSKIIEQLYKDNQVMPLLLKRKMGMFEKHKDIAEEFEYWIQNGKYVSDSPLEIEGYTAERLAREISNLDGEGAFIMLIELREDPQKAIEKLKGGFKQK